MLETPLKHDSEKEGTSKSLVINLNILVEESYFDQQHHSSESVTWGKDQSHLLPWYQQQCWSSVKDNGETQEIQLMQMLHDFRKRKKNQLHLKTFVPVLNQTGFHIQRCNSFIKISSIKHTSLYSNKTKSVPWGHSECPL